MLFEDVSTSFYFCCILEDWKFCRASQAVFNLLIVFIFIYTELLFSTTNKLKIYVYITNKIKCRDYILGQQNFLETKKKKKKSPTVHIFCRKRRARTQQGAEEGTAGICWRGSVMAARAAGSWCQALGSGLLASGCCQVFNVQWARAQPPWSCLPLAVQVHRVFASWWVCGSFQQL